MMSAVENFIVPVVVVVGCVWWVLCCVVYLDYDNSHKLPSSLSRG